MAWLTNYSNRKKITIQTAYLDANLTDFPLAVKLNADSDIGAVCLANGFDVRFTSSDETTEIGFERESFSVSGGAATGNFWVKTSPQTTGTFIYCYYGNPAATDASSKTAPWDANYIGVYHFNDGSGTNADNSTGGTDFTLTGSPAWGTGLFGGALIFDGTNDLTNSVAFANNSFTMMVVAKKATITSAYGVLFGFKSSFAGVVVYQNGNIVALDNGGNPVGTMATARWTDTDFHHISFRQHYTDASNKTRYFNFDTDTVWTATANYDVATHYRMGDFVSAFSRYFAGTVDEARFSNTDRSDAWVKFERANLLEADNELTFGAQESNVTRTYGLTLMGMG